MCRKSSSPLDFLSSSLDFLCIQNDCVNNQNTFFYFVGNCVCFLTFENTFFWLHHEFFLQENIFCSWKCLFELQNGFLLFVFCILLKRFVWLAKGNFHCGNVLFCSQETDFSLQVLFLLSKTCFKPSKTFCYWSTWKVFRNSFFVCRMHSTLSFSQRFFPRKTKNSVRKQFDLQAICSTSTNNLINRSFCFCHVNTMPCTSKPVIFHLLCI